jgi:hypothetical protein
MTASAEKQEVSHPSSADPSDEAVAAAVPERGLDAAPVTSGTATRDGAGSVLGGSSDEVKIYTKKSCTRIDSAVVLMQACADGNAIFVRGAQVIDTSNLNQYLRSTIDISSCVVEH